MKKIYKVLFALFLFGSSFSILNAQLIFSESFNYSGNLDTKTNPLVSQSWTNVGTATSPSSFGTVQAGTFGTGNSAKICFETSKKTIYDIPLGQTILSDADLDGTTTYWIGFWYDGTNMGTAGAAQLVLVGTSGQSIDFGTGGNEGGRNMRIAFGKTSTFTVTGPPVDGAMTVFTRASPGGCAAQNWTTTSAPSAAAPGTYKTSVAKYYVLVKIIKGASLISFTSPVASTDKTDDVRIWHLAAPPTVEPMDNGDYGVINTRMLRDQGSGGTGSVNTGNVATGNPGCRYTGGGASGLRLRVEAGATSGSSCVEFDEIRIAKGAFSNIVLPIELDDISAYKKGASNILKWTTASEINNKGFHIERSSDASAWETIGFVKGVGNAQAKLNYSFTDNTPLSISYYRLRQEDNDGRTTHTKVVSVSQNSKLNVKIAPNPAKDVVNISLDKESEKNFVTVYDVVGRSVATAQFSGNQSELNVSNLIKGIYFINVQTDGKTVTQKFFKE
jgi:hypothetical protein